jgi:AcrR family transcriptional regulator
VSIVQAIRDPARRSARSLEAILAAATSRVARESYAAVAIEQIAADAGVSKQTIYRWWPNKAALFIDVYGQLVPRDYAAEDTGTLRGDIEALLAHLSQLYGDTPAGRILSGLIAEAQSDPALAAQLRATYVAPRRIIFRTILQRAERRGEIASPVDPDFASDMFSGAIWFRLLLGHRRLDKRFRRQLTDALLSGVVRLAPG